MYLKNFRNIAMQYYGLDPAHYLPLLHFAWDAMLKKTGVKIDLFSDIKMYTMVEKGRSNVDTW